MDPKDKAEVKAEAYNAANKTVDKKILYIITIIAFVGGCLAAFYSVSARVSVLESRTDKIEDGAQKYEELAGSINGRLSRIEGALGVTGQIKQQQ